MSIGTLIEKIQNVENNELVLDKSRLAIPFSIVFQNEVTPDIYTGEEIISFDERDLEFKQILMNEFLME